MMNRYKADDFDIEKLGSFYAPAKTIFRVFSPYYKELYLVIKGHSYQMHKKGLCFEIALGADLEGIGYHYETEDGVSFCDPFAYAAINGESIVVDPRKFIKEKITMAENKAPVIYECSVRDFSSAPSYCGKYKGKFLSFTEKGLKSPEGLSIGLDYLKELGISHLQLLPVFDFDNDKGDYNWGYNPVAYNHVKPAYLNDPDDPYAYVNELRKTVNVLHENGIRVVLDVVFNHVYNRPLFPLK